MSAYVVDKATIDTLITIYIVLERRADGSNEPPACSDGLPAYNKLGAMLWSANHRSVNYRYGEAKRSPSYRFEAVPIVRPLHVAALKRAHGALRSFVYQSCEFPRWEKSTAYKWIDKLDTRLQQLMGSQRGEGWDISDAERDTALTAEALGIEGCEHGVPFLGRTGKPVRCDRCAREEGAWEAMVS